MYALGPGGNELKSEWYGKRLSSAFRSIGNGVRVWVRVLGTEGKTACHHIVGDTFIGKNKVPLFARIFPVSQWDDTQLPAVGPRIGSQRREGKHFNFAFI